jgi:Amt family ammonium transporter
VTPASDGKGNIPEQLKPTDLYDRLLHNLYSINYVWVLIAGFLVMFMQAGFMLVETALCRAKNAAHGALALFFFMMVFMDTAAPQPQSES